MKVIQYQYFAKWKFSFSIRNTITIRPLSLEKKKFLAASNNMYIGIPIIEVSLKCMWHVIKSKSKEISLIHFWFAHYCSFLVHGLRSTSAVQGY